MAQHKFLKLIIFLFFVLFLLFVGDREFIFILGAPLFTAIVAAVIIILIRFMARGSR